MISLLSSIWIKQKSKIIMAIIIALLTGIIGFEFSYFQTKLNSSIDKNNRLTEVVLNTTIQYEDDLGRLVTETTEQRVTIQEYEDMILSGSAENSYLKEQIQSMKVKLKKVESMGVYGTETIYDTIPVFVYLKDSTNEIEYYTDNYIDLERKRDLTTDTAIYNISIKDSLVWSVNWYFRDKWKLKNLIWWRDKYYKLDAKLMNPKAEITYSQYYKFVKNGKRR